MVVRKSAYQLLKQRGFRPVLSGARRGNLTVGEDVELCYALAMLGYRVWYDDKLKLSHFIPMERLTRSYVLRLVRKIFYGDAVMECYETVRLGQEVTPQEAYWRGLKVHGKGFLISAVKLVLLKLPWVVFEVQLLGLWHALVRRKALKQAFEQHYEEIRRLKREQG